MIGSQISHYKIIEKIGGGGMGVVYKAHDKLLNRPVALKFLPVNLTENEESRNGLLAEAQIASWLDHPNICKIYEVNETQSEPGHPWGQIYISMAYYEGESLSKKTRSGPLPISEALNIIYKVALGLQAAHEKQIIHRDIKPGNIIITTMGEVKIVDFGLAKLVCAEGSRTFSSPGTTAYMSPEQICNKNVDHRCDIWALGIVLYELLTGYMPFEGKYTESIIYSILNEEFTPLSHYSQSYPEFLTILINKALKKNPKERYQDLGEILIDLGEYIYGDLFTIVRNLPRIRGSDVGIKVAVIPLASKSDNVELDWFGDAMADDLMTNLTRIGGLRVTTFFSSIKYKGTQKSHSEVAAELGVDYLLEPSSRQSGDKIKISVRLIDALKDEYIWAEEFESEFKDVLKMEGEIAKEIAAQIKVRLTPYEENLLTPEREVDQKIYSLYLQGMYHINKFTEKGFKKGLEYLHQAVAKDPQEPLAYAGLALGYGLTAHTPVGFPNALKISRESARKALELDESQAEAHLALGMVQLSGEWNKTGALKSFRRALELNPSLAEAHNQYGGLLRTMRDDEQALMEVERAKELDPLSPVYPAELGFLHYFAGNYENAINEVQQSLDLNPDFPQALCILGFCYIENGRSDEALALLRRAVEVSPGWRLGLGFALARTGHRQEALDLVNEIENTAEMMDPWAIALIYGGLEMKDKILEWLEIAYEQRHPYMQWIHRNEIFFGCCYDDERFKNLMRRLELPQ